LDCISIAIERSKEQSMNISEVLDYGENATATNIVAKMDRLGEDKNNKTEGNYQLGRLKDKTGEVWFILSGGGLDRDVRKLDEVTIKKAKVEIDSRGKKRLRFNKTEVVSDIVETSDEPKAESKSETKQTTKKEKATTTSRKKEVLPADELVTKAANVVAQAFVDVENALDGRDVSRDVVAVLAATAAAPVLAVLLDVNN